MMKFIRFHRASGLAAVTFPLLALVGCDSSVEIAEDPANAPLIEGPNEGFTFQLVDPGGEGVGTAEIKLHDDKGDLEVWINKGGAPWDLPLDSELTVTFPDLEKEVTLVVRDRDANADENGRSMIRDGQTNYFIFPGDTGVDASWLQGHDFAESAMLTFEAGGGKAMTRLILLKPHGDHAHGHDHGDGHDHPHSL